MENKKLFGSSGIRGDAKEFFTTQVCFDLGRAFSTFLNKHNASGPIAVGADPRESSPRIKAAFIKGLNFEKRSVFDQGITPIPSVNFLLKVDSSLAGSVMVSGSHIKAHMNGLKFFAFGEEILKDHESEIEDIYFKLKGVVDEADFSTDVSQITSEIRAKEEYINYIVSKSKFDSFPIKVVVDCGNGAQSEVAPAILSRLGVHVIGQNVDITSVFLSRDTEVSGDFQELQNRVISEKADLGIGYDSDGDRVVFVDELGNFIPGDYSGALIAKSIPGESVVTPINTSSVVEKIGKRVIRTKVGSPYVLKAMKDNHASFGFEANGGGIFNEMHSRDGGRSTIEFLNLLYVSKLKASELVASLPKYYIERDKVDYDPKLKQEILTSAKTKFEGIKVDETDGLKIYIEEDSWILFRSSANAPEFRVFTESLNKETAQNLLISGIDLVNSIVDKK